MIKHQSLLLMNLWTNTWDLNLLSSHMGVLHEGQGGLQAFELSHSIRVCDKLLDQPQVLPPLRTLLVLYPLKQLESFLVTVETSFPHLEAETDKRQASVTERETKPIPPAPGGLRMWPTFTADSPPLETNESFSLLKKVQKTNCLLRDISNESLSCGLMMHKSQRSLFGDKSSGRWKSSEAGHWDQTSDC